MARCESRLIISFARLKILTGNPNGESRLTLDPQLSRGSFSGNRFPVIIPRTPARERGLALSELFEPLDIGLAVLRYRNDDTPSSSQFPLTVPNEHLIDLPSLSAIFWSSVKMRRRYIGPNLQASCPLRLGRMWEGTKIYGMFVGCSSRSA